MIRFDDLDTGIEVERAEDRLDRIRQDRGLVGTTGDGLTTTESEVRTQVDLAGHVGQRPGVHELGSTLGQRALGEVGLGPVQVVGHDEAQHAVAQELKPFVRLEATVLGAPRPVPEREIEQVGVGEPMVEPMGQRFQFDGLRAQPRRART